MKKLKKRKEEGERDWYLADAKDKILGRLASEVTKILQGKHKPHFSYNLDCGDYVVIINAKYIKLTGNKKDKKIYFRHSGYPGGLKKIPFSLLFSKNPEKVVEKAIWGMIPHTRLGREMIKKLKVYPESDHPYPDKKFKILEIKDSSS